MEVRESFVRRNWGRWGASDERGAPNLLTPERVVAAVRLVGRGEVFALGRPLDGTTAVPPRRVAPALRMTRHGGDPPAGTTRLMEFADEAVMFATHTGTHVDSPAHMWYGGELYNGFSSASVGEHGAIRCGVERLGPLVGRGVLIDAAADGPLAEGTTLGAAELARVLERQGTELRSGDVVLVRTGWWAARAAAADNDWRSEPGPDLEGACWLAEHDPAAVGADNAAFEALPAPAEGGRAFPVHELLLRDCGVPILEGLDLDALASAGIHEFLFVAAPLPLTGATASPLNPLAVA